MSETILLNRLTKPMITRYLFILLMLLLFSANVYAVTPEPVTNIQVDCTGTTQTSLTYTWTHSANTSGDLAGYIVYFDGDTTGVTIPATQNTYTVSDLNPATSYEISITAIDGEDPANESESATITGVTLLNPPSNLEATPDYGSIHIAWDSVTPSDHVQNYNVYYQAVEPITSLDNLTPISTTDTSTTISGLNYNNTYYFTVTSVNLSGCENKVINTASATPLFATYVSGEITLNTTWTLAKSPYIVTGDITVRNKSASKYSSPIVATLTIEPGVEVRFNSGTSLNIGKYYAFDQFYFGALFAEGTQGLPITFTPNAQEKEPGQWEGVNFKRGAYSTQCKMTYCTVEYGGQTNNGNIFFDSAGASIQNCLIQYSSAYGINIQIASPVIQDNNIKGNISHGIYSSDTSYATISGNHFTDNGNAPVTVHPNSVRNVGDNTGSNNSVDYIMIRGGEITIDSTWKKLDELSLPFVVDGDITVRNSKATTYSAPIITTLTIQPGAQVRFNPGTGLYIGKYYATDQFYFGAFFAEGTADLPVLFTSNTQEHEPGQWKGINFVKGTYSSESKMEYCTVEYGGQTTNANITFESGSAPVRNCQIQYSSANGIYINTASPIIQDNAIAHNNNYGIYGSDTSYATISDNHFTDNGDAPVTVHPNGVRNVGNNIGSDNGVDYINIRGGFLSIDSTWKKLDELSLPFVVDGDVYVCRGGSGTTVLLTVESGGNFKFNNGKGLYIGCTESGGYASYGALLAQAENEDHITFTTNIDPPSPGDWKGIYISYYADSNATILERCIVEYAGYENNSNIYIDGKYPTIQYCTIRNSSYSGIVISRPESNSTNINCNNFKDNVYGIYALNNAQPTITGNNFLTNQYYGIYNASTVYVTATDNWWNDINGPNFNGDATYGNVNVYPWLTAESSCVDSPPTNTAPFTPRMPSPADNAVRTATNLTMTWVGGDPNPWDNILYDIYFGTDKTNLPMTAENLASETYDVAGLDAGTTYYWQIVSKDDGEGNLQATGPVWTFTTAGDPPDLAVADITWTPASNIQAGQEVTFTVSIANNGTGPVVDTFQVKLERNSTSMGAKSVSSVIPSNGTKEITWTWTAATGDFTLTASADTENTVNETYEDNNTYTVTLPHVTDPTPPEIVNHSPEAQASLASVTKITFTLMDQYGVVDDASVIASVVVTGDQTGIVSGTTTEADDTFTFTPDISPDSLADDTYTVSFNATDEEGNTYAYSFEFTVDSLAPAAPVITGGTVLSGVIQGSHFANQSNTETITLTGTRDDDTAVYINGTEQVAIGSGDWAIDLTLIQGDNAFEIYTKDTAGNVSPSEYVDVYVDSVAPVVTGITPANNSFINVTPSDVTIECIEITSGIDFTNTTRSITLNTANVAGTWTHESDSLIRFTPDTNFQDGEYTIVIQLQDNLGNQGNEETYLFTLDTTAPAKPVITGGTILSGVIQASPVENQSNKTAITLTGTREPDTSVWINGAEQATSGSTPWAVNLTLSQGNNTLSITLKDQAENESDPETVLIKADSIAPVANSITPAANTYLTTPPDNIVIEFSETTSSIDVNTSTLMVRNNSFAAISGTWEIQNSNQLVFTPQTTFGETQYIVTVQLKDTFGNTGTLIDGHTFTVDTTAPAAPVVNPVETPTHTITQTITGTREAYMAVYANSQEIISHEAGTTWSYDTSLTSGTNTFTFYAKDRAGNQSPDVVVDIVYDDVAPLPVTTLNTNGEGDGTTVNLVWTGYNESEHGDIASYKIFRKQDAAFTATTETGVQEIGSVSAGIFTYPAVGLTTGTTYYFAVVAVDFMGNFRTDVTSVAGTPSDTQAPQPVSNLIAAAPEAGKLIFTWTPSSSSDLNKYQVCFASDPCETITGPSPATTYEKTGLNPATAYTFQISALDANDNQSTGVTVTGYTWLDNPSGLSGTAYSGKVDLTWTPATPSEYVKLYAVYYQATTDFSSVASLTPAVTTTNTSVQVAGLTNNTPYYFAVTTVNLSNGENKTVAAITKTPESDSQGPTISNIKIGENIFTADYNVTQSDHITLNAEDSAGVSHVEFSIDGKSIKTDYSGPEYAFYLDAVNMEDGAHTLSIAAFDTLGNMTLEQYNFTITMAAPNAPVITQPTNGITVNQPEITVTGTAEMNTTITLYNNDTSVQTSAADATGSFSFTITLAEGLNKIETDAANRAGAGLKSAPVNITLDTSIPSAPSTLTAVSKENGLIRLIWSTPTGSDTAGYNLYRAAQNFSTTSEAEKINTSLITATQYDDLPATEGTWYYRVSSLNSATNESEPSVEAEAVSDSSGPRATIQYAPQGNVNPITGAMAPGRVDILLTVNEALQAAPFLTITPEAGIPISVELTSNTDLTYSGFITITESTPTATAWAVYSARDMAGNRGTTIDSGQSILIDTDGPAVNRLIVQPMSPIKNDELNPVTLQVTLGLTEKTKPDTAITLGYLLPSQGTESIDIGTVTMIETQPGDVETWQAVFELPANAGAGTDAETLSFTFSAQDSLDNMGTDITALNQFQIYQGDLPPLSAPTGLTGQALPGGNIQLTWNPVDNAVGYQVYRKTENETQLTEYARIDQGETYTDTVLEDGTYTYAVASIRNENSEEAISGQSSAITVTSDATAPAGPTGLVLDLISQGIRAQWTAPAGEDVTYRFYRAAADSTPLTEAFLVEQGFSQTSWIDFTPSTSEHYYMVTAVDEVGNESLPCTPAYLDFALLPVSGITIVQEDLTLPVITWTHPESDSIDGYNIYLGNADTGVMLNTSLVNARTYTDVGYSGDTRTYTLVAVNDGNNSLARSLTLPNLTAILQDDARLKRGLMNRLEFPVTNHSSISVGNITLKVNIGGHDHTSAAFSLSAEETAIIPVVVGGYDDLPDIADMVITIDVTPNTGETVQIIRSSFIEVDTGMLVLGIVNEEFTKGATGNVGFTLENTGEEEIEITIARNAGSSPSNDIIFYLLDEDGNILSTAGFKQTNDEYAVGLSNGNTIARIPAGETFTSDPISMNIPSNAPSRVIVKLAIGSIYYHQGKTDQVVMDGLETTHDVSLVETSYYGTVTNISPDVSSGDEDIVITGQAIERATGDPLSGVPLNLVITVKGFERTYTVYTEDDGTFTKDFTPLSGEAGHYTVRAMHPDLRDKPVHGSFVIERISVSPTTVNMNIARNYEQKVNISVKTTEGTTLSNVHLVYDDINQPEGVFPDGVTLTVGDPEDITSGGSANLLFTVWADNTADNTATMVLKVVSGDTEETVHSTVTVNAVFYDNKPVLYFTPNSIVTGMAFGDTVMETITLKNNGLADLNDVSLTLYNLDKSPKPDWVYISNVTGDLSAIEAGGTRDVIIAFSPPEQNLAEGIYNFYLHVESSNYQDSDIYLSANVTQSGIGNVLFKLSDIYTGTLDDNNQPVQGLSGATIRLQKEGLTTISATATSDAYGEAIINDLSAGQYRFRITAGDHQEQTGRFWIKPGITVNQEVFLDYNLVTVEWEVTETTIEDKYEITLKTTFVTDVPAAVVTVSPASITLPEMKEGDVYRGELTLTNQGLIRADNVRFTMPPDDTHYKYEAIGGIPESIEAKERVTIPYRITCLSPLVQEEESTGGGCETYIGCGRIYYIYICSNDKPTESYMTYCATFKPLCKTGDYNTGVGVDTDFASGGSHNVTGGLYTGPTSAKPAPTPTDIDDEFQCYPEPFEPENGCSGSSPAGCRQGRCQTKETEQHQCQKVGSSVSTLTREYTRSDIDLSVSVPGGKIEINRDFYSNTWFIGPGRTKMSDPSSPNLEVDEYGMLRANVKYYPSNDEVVLIVEYGPDGSIIRKQLVLPPGDKPKLYNRTDMITNNRWKDKSGNWMEYDDNGRMDAYGNSTDVIGKAIYDENGIPTGLADKNDNQVFWYEYNDSGLISAVRDADNRRVEYSYTDGLLTTIKDVKGYETFYTYDSENRLMKKTDAEGHERIISYNDNGDVKSVVDQQGKGYFFDYTYSKVKKEYYARIKNSAGMIKEVWYNDKGETIRVDINGRTIQKIGFDGRVHRTHLVTDENGNVTQKEYDEWDNLIKITYPDGAIITREYEHTFNRLIKNTDENGIITEYTYNESGNMIQQIEGSGTNHERITEYTYNNDGNVLTVKRLADADTPEALTVMTYDDLGNMTSITDPENKVTRFTSHDIMGNVLTKIDARNHEWTYTYDDAGRLKTVTDPLNNVTEMFYDKVGNKIREVDAEDNEKLFEYDDHDNLIKTTVVIDPAQPENNLITTFEYNSDNKLIKQTDPEGNIIQYHYDNESRMIRTTDGSGNVIGIEYSDGVTTGCTSCSNSGGSAQPSKTIFPTFSREYGYDKRGRKTIEKDVLSDTESHYTRFYYDDTGNLVTKIDKESKTTQYEYDDLNRLTKVIDPINGETQYTYDNRDNLISLTDAENNTTWFEYDKNNRLVKEIRPMGEETSYTYYDAGNLLEKIDAKNQKTVYIYDDAGRLTNIQYYAVSTDAAPVKTVTFTYDNAGNLKTYDDGTTTAIYNYDTAYRKVSETVNFGSFTKTNSYSYYKNGLKQTFTGPDNITYGYLYNNNNQLVGVQIPDTGFISINDYTWNRPASMTLPGGATKTYEYDPLMRIKKLTTKDPGQNILLDYQYTYDKADNITAKSTEHGNYDYGYDDLYRLSTADNPIQDDEAFTYDAVGNRLTSSDTTGNWLYNENNELGSYEDTSFVYDDNGNMVQKTVDGIVTNYVYGPEDRLTEVRDGNDQLIASYYYDPFGRRLWKEVGGTRTYFHYSDEGLVGEYDAAGAEIKTYGYKPGSTWTTDPLFMKVGTEYYFYHNDHLGTPQKMTAVNGAVVWSAKYSSFGKAIIEVETVVNNLRFGGQYEDQETGLYYNWNRFYDPATGRYITADPIGLTGGTNLYRYSKNHPLNRIDPFGTDDILTDTVVVVVVFTSAVIYYVAKKAIEGVADWWAERDDDDDQPVPIPIPRLDDKMRKGWYWCDARCDVHPTPYVDQEGKKCKAPPSTACPKHTEGSGIGRTLPLAKQRAKNNAQRAIKGHIGCRTRHCHTLRCKKI